MRCVAALGLVAGLWVAGVGPARALPLLSVPALRAARQLQTGSSHVGSAAPLSSGASPFGSGMSVANDSALPPWWPNGLTGNSASPFPPALGGLPPCPMACVPIASGVSPTLAQSQYEQHNQCSLAATCQSASGMSVSANYLNSLLPAFEGDVHQYYNDSECNCTAGVGHLVQHGQCPPSLASPEKQKSPQATDACVKNTRWNSPHAFPGTSVSNAQITAWEQEDIAWAVNKAKQVLHGKAVTQTEFDAIVDLIYNGGLYPSHHIENYIRTGNFEATIKSNTTRGKNNHVPKNRINFENSGLAEGNSCK